ncbi:MAG TPA: polysaccharide biosynthesis/export family protein [Bryobacteraceae bacterium]|nr:polysaccharide biosynthesis/export family protein [Bryobacteraceae bacterium]
MNRTKGISDMCSDKMRCRKPLGRLAACLPVAMIFLIGALLSPAQVAPNAKPPSSLPPAASTSAASSTIPNVPAGYRIGAGDSLGINVWREQEASVQSVTVRPDGKISLPLVKEVDVLGLTPSELEKLLTSKLEPVIRGVDVTVVVREIRSKKVYLIGAVNKVGPVPLLSDMTVLQALAEAGGITDFAKKKNIYVMRNENGKQVKLPFNYVAVIKGEHIEQNIKLQPDDTIVVPH